MSLLIAKRDCLRAIMRRDGHWKLGQKIFFFQRFILMNSNYEFYNESRALVSNFEIRSLDVFLNRPEPIKLWPIDGESPCWQSNISILKSLKT